MAYFLLFLRMRVKSQKLILANNWLPSCSDRHFAKNYTSKMHKTVKTQTNLPVKIIYVTLRYLYTSAHSKCLVYWRGYLSSACREGSCIVNTLIAGRSHVSHGHGITFIHCNSLFRKSISDQNASISLVDKRLLIHPHILG